MSVNFRVLQVLKRTLWQVATAALALSLISCAGANPRLSSLMAERPKDEGFRTELKSEQSSLNISIGASAGELSELVNRLIGKELYKGATKTNGVGATVLRNGPILVSAADGYLFLTIPISLSLNYSFFETPTLHTALRFKLSPKVTPDWRLNVEVYYLGLSDTLAEELRIGPISIKPRGIVEAITNPVQRSLSGLIGGKLNEKFPLKAQVAKVWSAAYKPILLDKKYNAWLKLTPSELLLYPIYVQNNQVKLSVGLRSFAELVVGPEPPARTAAPLPNLKLVNGMDNTFRIALNTDLFYRDLLNIASPLLLNKELGSDGKSVVLKELELYGSGERLMVRMVTTGSLEGTFYLACKPVFNPQTNVFSVEQLDFDLQSKSLLLQSADWFLHGTIRDAIKERLTMDLTPRLAQAREMAGKAVARVNLADKVFLTGSIKSLKLNDLMVQRDKISIRIYTEGETAIAFH